jgi:hypothetical protein
VGCHPAGYRTGPRQQEEVAISCKSSQRKALQNMDGQRLSTVCSAS